MEKLTATSTTLTPVVLQKGDNAERVANAVPLAMHTLGCPVHLNKPIPRNDHLCFCNIFDESQISEIKTVTSWGINTRWFLVFLANNKQTAWSTSIQVIISRGSSTYDEIKTLVRHFNNCRYIIPLSRHFLHPIRGIMRRSANKRIKFSSKEIRYLQIW